MPTFSLNGTLSLVRGWATPFPLRKRMSTCMYCTKMCARRRGWTYTARAAVVNCKELPVCVRRTRLLPRPAIGSFVGDSTGANNWTGRRRIHTAGMIVVPTVPAIRVVEYLGGSMQGASESLFRTLYLAPLPPTEKGDKGAKYPPSRCCATCITLSAHTARRKRPFWTHFRVTVNASAFSFPSR